MGETASGQPIKAASLKVSMNHANMASSLTGRRRPHPKRRNTMRTLLNTAIALVAIAAAAAPASASPIDGMDIEQVRTTVDIRGLEVREVNRRISIAARRACGAPETRS